MKAMRHLFITAMMLCAALPAIAQERWGATDSTAARKHFMVSINWHNSSYGKHFEPSETSLEVGYLPVKWLIVSLRYEAAKALSEVGDMRTFERNHTLGVGLTAHCARMSLISFDAKLTGGTTLLDRPWRYTYYDAGVGVNAHFDVFAVGVAIGARYYDSRGEFMGDKVRAYGELGLKWYF